MKKVMEVPMLVFNADSEINHLIWPSSQPDWV